MRIFLDVENFKLLLGKYLTYKKKSYLVNLDFFFIPVIFHVLPIVWSILQFNPHWMLGFYLFYQS